MLSQLLEQTWMAMYKRNYAGPAVATSGLTVHGSKVFKTVTNINVDGNAGVEIGVAGTGTDIDSLIETSTNIAAAGTYVLTGALADSQNLDAYVTITGTADESVHLLLLVLTGLVTISVKNL